MTNTPHFNAPTTNASSVTFGEITSTRGEREIQFALNFIVESARRI